MVEHKADLNLKWGGVTLKQHFKNNKKILSALFDTKPKTLKESSSDQINYWQVAYFKRNLKYYHF